MSEPADDRPPAESMRTFGPEYAEDLTLRNGSCARLRLVRPSDKQHLVAGLARLSPHSRYLRFFTDKEDLSDAELRYFTEVDGESHFAMGVVALDEDGREGEGLGIGRFICLPTEPEVAEPALAILDSMQGQGLGGRLMLRLIAAATERGVQRFRCDFLAVNRSMAELLRDVAPEVEFVTDGPIVTAEFPLPTLRADEPMESAPTMEPLSRWFELAAVQVGELRRKIEEQGEELLEGWRELQQQVRARVLDGGDDS
ncbi:MAG: GNAT family N-acetyltransferase [Myxococcota bacterium]